MAGKDGGTVQMDTREDGAYTVAELAQIIDNLRHMEPDVRMAAVRELPVVAAALGPERTRTELLPFLLETVDDEDEVLLALAEELERLVPLVGGPAFAFHLLPAFEMLVQVEEAVVREQAVKGLTNLTATMPPAHVAEYLVPLADSITAAHWYTTRTAACSVLPAVYRVLPATQEREAVLSWFKSLCNDPTPMVRRAACKNLSDLVLLLDPSVLGTYVLPLFRQFAKDEQDSVRLLSVNLVAPMAKARAQDPEMTAVLMDAYAALAKDSSWRVRYMVADTIAAVQEAVHPSVVQSTLLPLFVALLSDPEPEVRSAIAEKVLDVCSHLPEAQRVPSVISRVIPLLGKMVVDDSQHVRASLASVIMGLSGVIGKDATIEHLLPLILQLLRDEFSEVRLNIISHLDVVNKVIGVHQLSQSLLPAIEELASHTSWRVRLAMIEYIPLVSRQLGQQLFNEQLLPMCLRWLKDPIAAVRTAAAQNFQNIVKGFGASWAKTTLLPPVLEMARDSNFVSRLTALLTATLLMDACDGETVGLFIVPCVCSLQQDKIPNIRLNVARGLQSAITMVDRTVQESQIHPTLKVLQQDSDPDVSYYAAKAMEILQTAAESSA